MVPFGCTGERAEPRRSPLWNAGQVRDGGCQMQRGEAEAPPLLKVCTLVCTLAYSNPVYGQKIVLGPSGRIPYTYWRIVKNGAWRSPVARLLWEQEVPGSNPGAPT